MVELVNFRVWSKAEIEAHKHPAATSSDPYLEFAGELQSAGYDIKHIEETTESPIRVNRNGSRDKPAWYFFRTFVTSTGQLIGFGNYGDWRDGVSIQWNSKGEISKPDLAKIEAEREKQKREIERIRKETQQKKAAEADGFVSKLQVADANHPYLKDKGVKPWGILQHENKLVIPMHDARGDVKNYQTISQDGKKLFLKGAQKLGTFYQIGQIKDRVYIAEGYATAATIHEITGHAVAVAFDTSNIAPTLNEVRKAFSGRVIFAADNDAIHPKDRDKFTEGAGERYARKAMDQASEIIMPPTVGHDFNDWLQSDPIACRAFFAEFKPEQKIKIRKTTAFQEPRPLDYVIDDFLVEGTSSMLFGPPGVCKSFLAQDMGMCVATGQTWAGSHDVFKGAVLYVCGEGHEDLPQRIQAWKMKHRLDQHDEPPFYNTEHEVNIRDPLLVEELKQSAEALPEPVKFVIVDTLSTNFGGGDENSGDMTDFINRCNQLARDLRAHVMIVHHTGKDASRGARGNSSNHGNVYTYMEVSERDERTALITHKQKGGKKPDPILFTSELIHVGEAEDRKGRIQQITSLVMNVEHDASVGAEVAANLLINKPKRNETFKLKIWETLEKLAESGSTFSRADFVSRIKMKGCPANKTSDAVADMLSNKYAKDLGNNEYLISEVIRKSNN